MTKFVAYSNGYESKVDKAAAVLAEAGIASKKSFGFSRNQLLVGSEEEKLAARAVLKKAKII